MVKKAKKKARKQLTPLEKIRKAIEYEIVRQVQNHEKE